MYTEQMKQDMVEAVTHTLQNPLTLPEGAQEPARIVYADQMDGVWVCGEIVADLKNAKTVAGVAVENVETSKYAVDSETKVVTAEDNDVIITLTGVGNVQLSRLDAKTMKVKSIPAALADSGIAVGSVFTFQAN